MTDLNLEMLLIAIVWLAAVVFTARLTARSSDGSVGLSMAFLFSMTFLYIGFFVYAVPGYSHLRADGSLYLQSYKFTEETVRLGVWASLIGVLGFFVGNWLMTFSRGRSAASSSPVQPTRSYQNRVLWGLGLFGFAGFALNGMKLEIPMIDAFLQVGRNTAVVAVCLGAALALRDQRTSLYWRWLAVGVAIPFAYLVIWGFASYGFLVFTCFAGFWLAVLAPRRLSPIRTGIGGASLTYVMLSVFVAWMSFREQLRAMLWDATATYNQRFVAIMDAFEKTELLSPGNFESLDWLNTRLNQYIFVGKAIEWHELVPSLRLNGESIFLAALAWMPRFMWPGKPEMGGSKLVAMHTGMHFSSSATFGAGPVFEFYINFGYVGVFFGFVVLGVLVRWIDRSAARAFHDGRLLDCVRLFTVGLAFIAPLTDFFFMVNTALMSWLVMTSFKWQGMRSGGPSPRGARR